MIFQPALLKTIKLNFSENDVIQTVQEIELSRLLNPYAEFMLTLALYISLSRLDSMKSLISSGLSH